MLAQTDGAVQNCLKALILNGELVKYLKTVTIHTLSVD